MDKSDFSIETAKRPGILTTKSLLRRAPEIHAAFEEGDDATGAAITAGPVERTGKPV